MKKEPPKASKICYYALSQNMDNLQIPNDHPKLTLSKTIKTPQLKAFGEVSNFQRNLWLAHNQKTWRVLFFLETHWSLCNQFSSLTLTSWEPPSRVGVEILPVSFLQVSPLQRVGHCRWWLRLPESPSAQHHLPIGRAPGHVTMAQAW